MTELLREYKDIIESIILVGAIFLAIYFYIDYKKKKKEDKTVSSSGSGDGSISDHSSSGADFSGGDGGGS